MTVFPAVDARPASVATALPCNACLFDQGDASGMAGAQACPWKIAFLKRVADARRLAGGGARTRCDAFSPGFACGEADPDGAAKTALNRRLS